jgi:hypothetical protein
MKSKCCLAEVTVDGDDTEGTHYHVCTQCVKPCDVFMIKDGPEWKKVEKKLNKLSAEDLQHCAKFAAELSGFMQNFKMKVWEKYPNRQIGEGVLDELAIIAWELLKEKEIVICAAVKTPSGLIVRGHRHCDCYHNISQRPGYEEPESVCYCDEGFITSKNRYVDRNEGWKIQTAAGIASADPGGYRHETLFSEDLY